MVTPPSPSSQDPDTHPAEAIFLRYRFWIFGFLTITLAIGAYLMVTPNTTALPEPSEPTSTTAETESTPVSSSSQIVVDISGGVTTPGVYFLANNSIVEDGIKAAGGFSSRADMSAIAKTINRAQKLEAHTKVYIPQYGDTLAVTTSSTPSSTSTNSSKVNINTATPSQLDILPGVGPVTAQRIIDYRIENGDFQSITEIQQVPGISTAKFDQLKDMITT